MAFPENTLFRVKCTGRAGDNAGLCNVFHFYLFSWGGSDLSEGNAETYIKAHITDLWNQVRPNTQSDSKWTMAECDYLLPGTSTWVSWRVWSLNLTGNDTSHELPAGVSALVTGPTAKKGRRARKFLPPFGELYNQDQQWTTGAVTNLALWAVKWVTGIDLTPYSKWIYPIAYSAITGQWSAVVEAVANAVPAYQRRRKPGKGF